MNARERRLHRHTTGPTLIPWKPLTGTLSDRTIASAMETAFPQPIVWWPENRKPLQPHQVPPPHPWRLWILEGGRGSGKTEGGSRYFCKYMREHPGARGRIIAPTQGDAVESCVTGPSGVLSVDPEVRWLPSAIGGAKLVWPNKSEALVLGTHTKKDVDRLRAGGNRDIDWWEEAAANKWLKEAWDQAAFGLRSGDWPHSIATSTPAGVPAYRALREKENTVRTHGTIEDNPHLDPDWKKEMIELYRGTRIGRQELDGELLTDVPGALWTWAMIESAYASQPGGGPWLLPDLKKVVVAVDPAAKSKRESDDTGIVVAGRGHDEHGYILDDLSCHETPDRWARAAIQAYIDHEADWIVAETNNGGEMVEAVINTAAADMGVLVKYKSVTASRGKKVRAEPISTLYEQERCHHMKKFAQLDDQLLTWDPEGDESPDRLDAAVWALTELGFAKKPKRWSMI